MWDWLAENPVKHKEDWIKLKEIDKSYLKNECPACQYVIEQDEIPDSHIDGKDRCAAVCPMKSLWPRGCCTIDSPYQEWRENKRLGAKTAASIRAREIANHARLKLAELNKEAQ